MGGFWKLEEVDFEEGEIEEGAVGLVGQRLRQGKHEPGELRREVMRDFWDRDTPRVTDGSESEVIGVNREILGD